MNAKMLMQGRSDHPLNETGIRQAEEAAKRFADMEVKIDKVYSSPLERAVRTAKIIAPSAETVIDGRLIEMDYGPYEGMDLRDPAPEVMDFFEDFINVPAPEGMEALPDVVARLGSLLEEIKDEASEKNVLLSTHAIAMKGALEYLTPASRGSYWAKNIGNCDIYAADVIDGGYTVPVMLDDGKDRSEKAGRVLHRKSRADIVFIGTAIMDSMIRGFDPEPVSSAGYTAESGYLSIGGEAVNGSIASVRLGSKAAILCTLGRDMAGDMIASRLAELGVDTSRIVRSDGHPTPVTTIFMAPDGNRRSITNGAHRYNFHPERYKERFSDARAVVLGSLFRAPFNDPDVIRDVVGAAKANGQLVFADTKLPNFRRLSLDDIADTLPMIDYITPNEDEARWCTGEEDPERMADVFLSYGVRNVIVKLGGRGCCFKNRDESIYLPACSVDVIDATGAGDNFLAGFATEILRGTSAAEALAFANACGAICSTAVGSGAALKNRQQVEELLAKQR